MDFREGCGSCFLFKKNICSITLYPGRVWKLLSFVLYGFFYYTHNCMSSYCGELPSENPLRSRRPSPNIGLQPRLGVKWYVLCQLGKNPGTNQTPPPPLGPFLSRFSPHSWHYCHPFWNPNLVNVHRCLQY